MKYLKAAILSLAVLVSACSTIGKTPEFPPAPPELLQDCKDLIQVEKQQDNLKDVLQVVLANYSLYHECRAKQQGWIEWYNLQKKIHKETLR